MANPYERMKTNLILEAEEGVLDNSDEFFISLFSKGESDKCLEDDEDDLLDLEEDR